MLPNSEDWPWLWIRQTAHNLDHIVQPWKLIVKEFCLWLWEARAGRLTWQLTSKMEYTLKLLPQSTLSLSPPGQGSFHLRLGVELPCLPLRRKIVRVPGISVKALFPPQNPITISNFWPEVCEQLSYNGSSPHFTFFSTKHTQGKKAGLSVVAFLLTT